MQFKISVTNGKYEMSEVGAVTSEKKVITILELRKQRNDRIREAAVNNSNSKTT